MDNPIFSSNDAALSSVRAILLAEAQERIHLLEQRIAALQQHSDTHDQDQQAQWTEIHAELQALQELAHNNRQFSQDIQAGLQDLEGRALTNLDNITTRLTPMMTNLIRRSIHDSGDEMAEALGPVMSEAVRVQIRDSRQDMVDALYPIIGETVQRSISEFARELQRNIDMRLKSTFGPEGVLRALWARLRGVSAAELTLRDAMPFSIREIFVIQHSTGMLMMHSHPGSVETADSDLISAMLTAIRSFVRDAFSQDGEKELDEIQYGDERIIIQSGKHVYIATVIQGVESEGFRGMLHQLVSDLHTRYSNALRDYDGDPAGVPNMQPMLAQWVADVGSGGASSRRKMNSGQRLALVGGGLLLLLGLLAACFYLWFTVRLWPVAFPGPTATPTATATATATATLAPTATHTATPTAAATATLTSTPMPAFTATNTPEPTVTETPYFVDGYVIGDLWARDEPSEATFHHQVVLANTPVKILAVYGQWTWIEWITPEGPQQGWVLARWVATTYSIPAYLITPVP